MRVGSVDKPTVAQITDGNGVLWLWVWCPGCDKSHAVSVGPGGLWGWDGDGERPTIDGSILVHPHERFAEDGSTVVETPRCHSYLRGGRWQFLPDSSHKLAGQTAGMVPVPDWLVPL